MHDGEAQAGAFARLLRGEERIEDALDGRGVHALPIVADGKAGEAPRTHAREPACGGGIQRDGPEPHLDAPGLISQSVPGVGAEIDENLVDLGGVSEHRRDIRLHRRDDLDGGRNGRAQELGGLLDQRAERHRVPLHRLLAAERQDLLHETLRAG